jgi:hypothetical protein
MSILGRVWDTAGELIVWAVATADEVSGIGQALFAVGDSRDDVEHCALPGFYSGIKKDDKLLTLRRDDGGVSLAAKTDRPSGCQPGDRGLLTSSVHLRARSGKVSVLGIPAGTTRYVTRATDTVNPATNMTLWMQAISAALGVPVPTDFGVATASTTKLESD